VYTVWGRFKALAQPGRCIGAYLSWLGVFAALAVAGTRDDRWVSIRTAHFELFTEGGEASGRDLLHHFEQVRSFFQQAYGLNGRGRVVRIVCLRSARQFQYYESSKIADAAFHPGSRHDYILMKNDAADRYPMAVHEYTHLVLRATNHDIPVWLDEGLAEVYSNLEPHGSFVVVGRVIPARAQALAEGPWIDLRTLISANRSSEVYNKQADAEMFYAESWALVHMLALDNEYSPRLKSLMDLIEHRRSVEAFQTAYGKPIEQVEADLRAYLDNSRLNSAVFQVRLPQADPPAQVKLKAGLEARLALAEMLLDHPGRTAEAGADFDRLLRDYPQRAEAEQGMGEFLAHERRDQEAAAHFARAESLGDQDGAMYLDYGRSLAVVNRLDAAVTALRKAIALGPSLDAAHHELAILLVKTGAFGEALEQFRAVKRLPPIEAPRYYYNLAYAHFKLGDVEHARSLAEKARQVARNADDRERVEGLMKEIEGNR
jgi:tetratricopeptide (TPR) repeat protein